MSKHERIITDIEKIEFIINQCQFCRIGMCDGTIPYIVPLCFGYKPGIIYVHCAPVGRKIDIIKKNPNVCFQMDCETSIVRAESPCKWGVRFRSVTGNGSADMVNEVSEKRDALQLIMRRYSLTDEDFEFHPDSISRTTIIRIRIESVIGKRSGSDTYDGE